MTRDRRTPVLPSPTVSRGRSRFLRAIISLPKISLPTGAVVAGPVPDG